MISRCGATIFSTTHDDGWASNLVEAGKGRGDREKRPHLSHPSILTDSMRHIHKRTFQNRIVSPLRSDIGRIRRIKILLEAAPLDHRDSLANSCFHGKRQSATRGT